MKTCVYVDGFNLYRSILKGTPYKWLDLLTLFRDHILATETPKAEIVKIEFFTAPVKASYSQRGKAAEISQSHYLRALRASHPSVIEVVQGFHLFEHTALPTWIEGVEANKNHMFRVWLIEEKQTDVQMALHIYRDAVLRNFEQLVICTNDSDFEPCLELTRQDAPQVRVGLVTPLAFHNYRPSASNKRLTKHCDWVRRYIRPEELATSQMRSVVHTGRKPARKPAHW